MKQNNTAPEHRYKILIQSGLNRNHNMMIMLLKTILSLMLNMCKDFNEDNLRLFCLCQLLVL
jgi:hypothetical protein